MILTVLTLSNKWFNICEWLQQCFAQIKYFLTSYFFVFLLLTGKERGISKQLIRGNFRSVSLLCGDTPGSPSAHLINSQIRIARPKSNIAGGLQKRHCPPSGSSNTTKPTRVVHSSHINYSCGNNEFCLFFPCLLLSYLRSPLCLQWLSQEISLYIPPHEQENLHQLTRDKLRGRSASWTSPVDLTIALLWDPNKYVVHPTPNYLKNIWEHSNSLA